MMWSVIATIILGCLQKSVICRKQFGEFDLKSLKLSYRTYEEIYFVMIQAVPIFLFWLVYNCYNFDMKFYFRNNIEKVTLFCVEIK